jgi:hypothetical protein
MWSLHNAKCCCFLKKIGNLEARTQEEPIGEKFENIQIENSPASILYLIQYILISVE